MSIVSRQERLDRVRLLLDSTGPVEWGKDEISLEAYKDSVDIKRIEKLKNSWLFIVLKELCKKIIEEGGTEIILPAISHLYDAPIYLDQKKYTIEVNSIHLKLISEWALGTTIDLHDLHLAMNHLRPTGVQLARRQTTATIKNVHLLAILRSEKVVRHKYIHTYSYSFSIGILL